MKPAEFQLHSLALLTAAALACMPAHAAPKKTAAKATLAPSASPCSQDQQTEMGIITLELGKSKLIRRQPSQPPLTRLLVGNPQNTHAARPSEDVNLDEQKPAMRQQQNNRQGAADLDVLLLSPSEIYLLGKSVGSTNIVLLDRAGRCTVLDVIVGMDTAALKASLKELMPGEKDIKIHSAADSLVLSGEVSDAATADRIIEIANAYVRGGSGTSTRIINMLQVAAPQQVMLEVKVAEISKSLLDQFGINLSRAYSPADGSMVRFISGIFGGNGLLAGQVAGTVNGNVGMGLVGSMANNGFTLANTVPAGNASIGGDTTTVPIITGKNMTSLGVNAQKQDGLVKVLAEPNVMAISGQEGSFLAGGKVFIPVSNNNGSGGTSITLEEKEFGVSLKFTPTVLSSDRINLKVNPEVSELSTQGVAVYSSSISGSSILPAFTTRRASTTVQLKDGQSFVIGGLIKNNVSSSITAFPFLGEIPIIGALFRSTSFQNDRTELVFVITPHLVKPLPPDYQLPTDSYAPPSRYDMIMGGKLEGSARDKVTTSTPETSASTESKAGDGFEVK